MDSTVSDVVGHDTSAVLILVHNEVHGEVLNEENAVVSESSSEESVEHRVAGSVSDSAASVGLTAFSVVSRLSSESSLVDLSFSGSREGHAVAFEFSHGDGGLSGHVLDGVLISEPVSSFDGIIEVPLPVVIMHISKSSVNTSLGCYRV